MKKYKQLTLGLKYQIFAQKQENYSISEIARVLNEHTNGLIREYIPKKSKFDKISKTEIIHIQNRLNNRPRKVLEYKTPNEVFFKILQRKLSE